MKKNSNLWRFFNILLLDLSICWAQYNVLFRDHVDKFGGVLEMRAAWTSLWAPLRLALALFLISIPAAWAVDPLPAPTGKVILVVKGNIAVTNSSEGAEFDREMLYALGLSTVETTTAWTDGVQIFEGVLLSAVLERLGATGTLITATALNDYVSPIPFEEATTFGVLLAASMNGAEMTVRDRGPLWVVYPRDSHAILHEARYNDRWVWQLRELKVE